MKLEDITHQAMHLSEVDRVQLANQLLESLEDDDPCEVSAIWLEEAKRRATEIDQGKVQLVSASEVAQKARALIK